MSLIGRVYKRGSTVYNNPLVSQARPFFLFAVGYSRITTVISSLHKLSFHMMKTDSNLFIFVFNRKSVPQSQGRVCVLTSLFQSMNGAKIIERLI